MGNRTCIFLHIVIVLLMGYLTFLSSCQSSGGSVTQKHAGNVETKTDQGIKDIVTVPPQELGLDSFYKKYLDASGIPVISSEKVPNEAFFAVRKIVATMMSMREDILAKMIENKMRIGIMAVSEVTKDMPEFRDLEEDDSGRFWNDTRGTGATTDRPLSLCAEENVLCYRNDDYNNEDILIHEVAHGIHTLGILFVDIDFDTELKQAFDNAKAKGLWINTYAGSNPDEYFAEGVQSWFNVNDEAVPSNGIHNEINTREELKSYDPVLYNIIRRYFPESNKIISCHQ